VTPVEQTSVAFSRRFSTAVTPRPGDLRNNQFFV